MAIPVEPLTHPHYNGVIEDVYGPGSWSVGVMNPVLRVQERVVCTTNLPANQIVVGCRCSVTSQFEIIAVEQPNSGA